MKYWCDDGAEGYVSFDSFALAEAFYNEQDAMAVIQRYNEERNAYEDVVFPIFEF